MSKFLPQLNSFGVFTLLPPLTITAVDYRCSSLQLVSELLKNNVDVLTDYYLANGLTVDNYNTDLLSSVAIVTLVSEEGPTLTIPSSYITNTPVFLAVPYSRIVISLELGELPDDLPISQLLLDITTIATNTVGVIPIPRIHKIPINKNINTNDHQIKELTRQLNVNKAISFYTSKLAADAELVLAKEKIHELENIVIALTPP
jgi:hypothetical protein